MDHSGNLFKNYPKIIEHNIKSVSTANSVVIAFRRKKVLAANLTFNTNFGLGNRFATAEEYIFLRDALDARLNVTFCPEILLSHPNKSSGKDGGSDSIVYARAALFYKYSGKLAYLRLCKYIWGLYSLKFITFKQIIPKYEVGIKGIKQYQSILEHDI